MGSKPTQASDVICRDPRHTALLCRAVEVFRKSPLVRGLWVAGSVARGEDGPLSDVDLFVGADETSLEELFAKRRKLAASVGRILAGYERTRIRDHVVLYEGGIRIEYIYCSLDRLTVDPARQTPIRVLYDPDGRVGRYQRLISRHVRRPRQIARRDLEDRLNWFVVNFWLVYSRIRQGRLWEAFDVLHDVRTEIVKLARVEHDLEPNKYENLEQLLPPARVSALSSTVTDTDARTLATGLLRSIGLCSKIARPLACKCGAAYPTRAIGMIRRRVHALPRRPCPRSRERARR